MTQAPSPSPNPSSGPPVRRADALPVVLVPGLLTSPRLYGPQLPMLWQSGPTVIADNTRDDSMAAIASSILAAAPPRFALVGLSMGGYISFEIMRQAPGRVAKLALLNTSARPDTSEQIERRRGQLARTAAGRFDEIPGEQFPLLFHPDHLGIEEFREITRLMAWETGPEGFVRQQRAIIARPDSRPGLGAITCPTLVLAGDTDRLLPPEHSFEMADAISKARLVVVPECGHLSTLDQPRATTDALRRWLAD